MAIDKKLIHFKTWNKFIEQIGSEANITTPTSGKEEDGTALYGQIKGTSIVFIKDVGKIWTHGNLYGENEIVIDDVLSDTSENPVKGNVIKEYVDLHPQYESIDEIDIPEIDLPMIECDSELSTTSIKPVYNRVITQALNNKVDKVSGKQLSTEDFTTSLKNKLVGLKEFDPTEINNEIDALAQQVNTKQDKLVSGTSIKTINGESILGNGDIQVVAEITVDSSVSDTSTNPIQNKAIKDYVDSNIYEQRLIYSVANGTLTTSQRTYNAETYTKLINREKIAVYYSDFNNTPLIPLSVGSMNMMTNVITLVHYSGVAPDIATTTFELHSDGNVESASMLYVAPSIDAALSSTSTNSIQNKVITAALNNKIDKVTGKGLSTEDFTTALKTKLEGLTNYDDAAIQNAVNGLTTQLNTLVNGDASVAIESFNEIIAFLNGVEDSESLDSIIASIEQQIAGKQNKLVSGTNIKTLNGESILGEGNIVVNVDTSNLATKDELIEVKEVAASVFNDLRERIDGIPQVEVDAELSSSSENAIQNKVVASVVDTKVDKVEGKQLSTEDFTTPLKEKLEGLSNTDTSSLATKGELESLAEEIASNERVWAEALNDLNERINEIGTGGGGGTSDIVVDAALSTTSTNAIQNKAVANALNEKADASALASKQDTLVSGTNIKTVQGQSILGSGNISISVPTVDAALSSTSTNPVQNKVVKAELDKKQDGISDLEAIRSGAAKGETALQSVPSEYVTEAELDAEINGNSKLDIPTTAGTWLHPSNKIAFHIPAGTFNVRFVDDEGIISNPDNGIGVYVYDKDGNELLSGANTPNYFVSKTIPTDAEYVSMYVASTRITKTGEFILEFSGEAFRYGVKEELKDVEVILNHALEEIGYYHCVYEPTDEVMQKEALFGILDMSITPKEDYLYTVVIKNLDDFSQFSLYRAQPSSPRTLQHIGNFVNTITSQRSGTEKYSVTFGTGEKGTAIVDWDKIKGMGADGLTPDIYKLKQSVFNGGLLSNNIMVGLDDLQSEINYHYCVYEVTADVLNKPALLGILDMSITPADGYLYTVVLKNLETASQFSIYRALSSSPRTLQYCGNFVSTLSSQRTGTETYSVTVSTGEKCTATVDWDRIKGLSADGLYPDVYKLKYRVFSKGVSDNLSEQLNSLEDRVEDMGYGDNSPKEVFWAACGDSITNANHNSILDIDESDAYLPFDGYANLNTYKRKNYAYYIAQRNRIKWANYGWGGTTLSSITSKAYGYKNAFVDDRMKNLANVEWNYISVFFGGNDSYYGPTAHKDIWLKNTYGQDIGYPVNASQIGTSGFATQAQKDACDAVVGTVNGVDYTSNADYFLAKFIGTISDTATNTWYGALNTAVSYLMSNYPKAKIILIASYTPGSAKYADAVVEVAKKWGVRYLDFRDIPHWPVSSRPNWKSLPNPNADDGIWINQSGGSLGKTIDARNQAVYIYDGTHPTNEGYVEMSYLLEDTILR